MAPGAVDGARVMGTKLTASGYYSYSKSLMTGSSRLGHEANSVPVRTIAVRPATHHSCHNIDETEAKSVWRRSVVRMEATPRARHTNSIQ